MLMTTTNVLEGRRIAAYKGIVTGEAIIGANVFRDFLAGVRDIIGGRSGAYENALREAREAAYEEMQNDAERLGANAIVAVDIDYENITTGKGTMLMVSVSGTAVVIE
ncbi:heavy metal-binding domain-containing protein [Martelella endophytica]|uniref:UPF0145 protein TM49_01395 n=1 Tax=Martelella endophytica TaxID=1486262 RepID=A0A0D5LKG3_MAREN|nr:heavy metal-binding domain-containing protein [Martelella endophytica]AJY44641.1 hypothetical protein TM49_01395 [Martelella endophytica]